MHYIKAAFNLLLIAFFALLVLVTPFGIYAFTLLFFKCEYAKSVWVAIDQLGSALLGYDPDVTISSQVGFMAQQGDKEFLIMEKVINWIWYKATGEKNHCRENIEHDEY